MSKRKTILIFLAVLTAIFLFCDEKKDRPMSPWIVYGPAYYPLDIGNYWEYDVSGLIETKVKWTAVDTTRHPDGNLLYAYQQDDYQEPCAFKYYTILDDGVYYYTGPEDTTESCTGQRYPTVKRKILKTEMRDGDEWYTYNFPGSIPDTFIVATGINLHMAAGNFHNTILVVRRGTYVVDSLFYANGIGLVKGIYRTREPMSPMILEIEDYYIK